VGSCEYGDEPAGSGTMELGSLFATGFNLSDTDTGMCLVYWAWIQKLLL
jgi:hypothetical protein